MQFSLFQTTETPRSYALSEYASPFPLSTPSENAKGKQSALCVGGKSYPSAVTVFCELFDYGESAIRTWFALRELAPQGWVAIRVAEIADWVGCDRATIYRHLANKTFFPQVERHEGKSCVQVECITKVAAAFGLDGETMRECAKFNPKWLGKHSLFIEHVRKWKSDHQKLSVSAFSPSSVPANSAENINLEENTCKIVSTDGSVYLVDREDYEKYNSYAWKDSTTGYAIRSSTAHESLEHPKSRTFNIMLHREILGLPRTGLPSPA